MAPLLALLVTTIAVGQMPPETAATPDASPATNPNAAAESRRDATRELDPRLSSPRATMETFLQALHRALDDYDESAWKDVAASFDQPPADAMALRQRAKRLLEVLDRIGEVHVEELPDRTEASARNLTRVRYFPRPGDSEHQRLLDQIEEPPDAQIVLEKTADGSWKFSAQTLAGVDDLYRAMRRLPRRYAAPSRIVALLGPTFQKTPLWSWFSLLAAIFLGVLAGKIAQAACRSVADRFEARGARLRGVALDNLASPLSLTILAVGLTIGIHFIHLEPDVADLSAPALKFLYILAIGWLLYNLVDVIDLGLRRITEKTESRLDDMVVPLIRKTLRIFLVVVFTLVVAQNVFGLNITGWLAGLGIAGLAVSLAAQDSVKNLFGSITVFFDKPFGVGDLISFDGQDGVVEEIGFRSTKMRTLDGHLITVPNMKFIDNSVRNVAARQSVRRVLDVTVTYDTPPEKVEEGVRIIQGILDDPTLSEPFDAQRLPPRVFFSDYNADSLNIRVMYWFTLRQGRTYWDYMAHAQRFNLRLLRAFNEAGIEFAFPTRTLYLADDPKRRLRVALAR